jgi:replicative DNA helicase
MSIKLIPISEAINQAKNYINKRSTKEIKSLITPLTSLNTCGINGIEWGSIVTIAGMSGSGKTAIASIIETGLFDLNPSEKFVGLNCTFEMKASKLIGRKFSSALKVTTSELYSADKTFDQFDVIEKESEKLKKYPLYYLEDYTTAKGITNAVISLYHKYNPTRLSDINNEVGLILMIDHSILVKMDKSKESNRLEALHNLCEELNDLKKKYKIITIILSQLNRGIEASERRDMTKNQILHFPTKSDIYGSDSLYQFSDIVLIAHRPEMLNITYYGPNAWGTKDKIFLHYLKVREGEPGIAMCKNLLKYNQIEEINNGGS